MGLRKILLVSQKWQYLKKSASQSDSKARFGKNFTGKAIFQLATRETKTSCVTPAPLRVKMDLGSEAAGGTTEISASCDPLPMCEN